MAVYRKERVGELILSCLANELRLIEDERMDFLTLTAVEMSKDLKHATVFWIKPVRGHQGVAQAKQAVSKPDAAIVDLPHQDEVLLIEAALQEHKKHLKHVLSQELNLRYTPDLHFKYDFSVEQGRRMDSILQKLS